MNKIKELEIKRKYKILFILLFIYLITRIFFLFSINLFNPMECRVSTITHELIIGPSLPIFDYSILFGPHYPGRLLSGFLTVPFYLIFGESGISIKLMLLTLSAGIFCLVYVFLERFFSKKAAVIAALLMIFSIPVYTMSTLSQGSPHLENAFFEILIMFLFYNIFFGKKQNIKSFILFGLACGFAIFVNQHSLVMIFTCLLFWFVFDKKFFLRKKFLAFILSFFVGLIPWIYYNLRNNFISLIYAGRDVPFLLKIFGNELNFNRLTQIITKFNNLIIYDLPNSFMFNDFFFINSKVFSYVYLFIFVLSFVSLFYFFRKNILKTLLGIMPLKKFNLKQKEIKKETFIIFYLLIFFTIYSLSDFIIDHGGFGSSGYRYLVTFYIFIFIFISLILTKLSTKKIKISLFLLVVLIFLGLLGNLSLVSPKDIGKGIVYRPYCYEKLSPRCYDTIYKSENKIYQNLVDKGYALFIKERLIHMEISEAIEECNNINIGYNSLCYQGIGSFVYLYAHEKINETVLQCNKINKENRAFCYVGSGYGFGEIFSHNYPDVIKQFEGVNKEYDNYFFEGFGIAIGYYLGVIPTQAIRQCNKVDEEYRPYCFKGLGWSLAEKFGDNPSEAGKFAKYINYTPRDYFYKGIGSYIGLMFNHNITMAEEECNKLGNNSFYCLQGLDKYFKKIEPY